MHRLFMSLALSLAAVLPAAADDYRPVSDKTEFLSLIEGKELRLALFGIHIEVLENGLIEGRALGWDVTGTWDWRDGYFCREMDWGGSPIPANCQLVEARGDHHMRFTVDRGAGESAAFKLH